MEVKTRHKTDRSTASIVLREPRPEDGFAVNRLISACPPLDGNSVYCNLLQCSHFAGTSCTAVLDENIVGFVSGYRVPERVNTLFIWQVAIAESARNRGLAKKMLRTILSRPDCAQVCFLETTITRDNRASRAMFRGFAEELQGQFREDRFFTAKDHFSGHHDDEYLVTIGPFTRHSLQQHGLNNIQAQP